MTDTIDLLEAIGRDALLRHAPSEELGKLLAKAHASDALTAAVASGDSSRLSKELGNREQLSPQGTNSPAHEEDLDEDPLEAPAPTELIPPNKQ
jgi:hypothetical protein